MKKIFLITLIGMGVLLITGQALAGFVPCKGPECTPCDILKMVGNIVHFVLFDFIPPLAILVIAIGGGMMIISHLGEAGIIPSGAQGGPALFDQGKKVVSMAIIALVIIYTAWLLVGAFLDLVGVAAWTGLGEGGFNIQCGTP